MFKIAYELPNGKSFAFVSRSCSGSLGLMAIKQFFPEKLKEYNLDPNNVNTGNSDRLLGGVLVDSLPDGCAVMVRNPIDRFASLLNRTGYDLESALELLHRVYNVGSTPTKNNRLIERSSLDAAYHFMPYSLIINQKSKLFKFPDIASMAEYLGIKKSNEYINKISRPKKVFVGSELKRIEESYSSDLSLWSNF